MGLWPHLLLIFANLDYIRPFFHSEIAIRREPPKTKGYKMRSLFVAGLLAVAVSAVFASRAEALCGTGCHISISGACVVDGWGTVRNECPALSRPRPPCPFGTRFKHGACMPN